MFFKKNKKLLLENFKMNKKEILIDFKINGSCIYCSPWQSCMIPYISSAIRVC